MTVGSLAASHFTIWGSETQPNRAYFNGLLGPPRDGSGAAGTSEGGGEGAADELRPWANGPNPVGEPDAGNPPVRFDGAGELETEQGLRGSEPQRGNPDTRTYRRLTHRTYLPRLYQPNPNWLRRTELAAPRPSAVQRT